ncbi:MAG: hypothetical protein Q8Q28_02315 [Pseudomonadota bacterium]|nr:hypothetical protein [Pseudomonadota bacterium]
MSWLKRDRFGAEFANLLACNLWLYKFFPFLKWQDRVTPGNLKADALAGFAGNSIPTSAAPASRASSASARTSCRTAKRARRAEPCTD